MAFTYFDSCVPVAQSAVKSLTAILKKGEASEHGASLLQVKLWEDMADVTLNVFILAHTINMMAAKITGAEPAALERPQPTYESCYALLERVTGILDGLDRDATDARQDVGVEVAIKDNKFPMVLKNYTSAWSVPNILFHVTTVYANFRTKGVALGKFDYLGEFLLPYYDIKQIL